MFANRLRKNLERLERWAERERIECYRLYDADMPEYAFAIDIYGRQPRHVYVQEYAAPKTVKEEGARERRREVLAVLPDVLGVPLENVHSRVRRPQKGRDQYEKRALSGERHVVTEGGLKFWVNFRDYLDTGLFLDHRIVRGHAARLVEWSGFPQFVLLHGQRDSVRGGRRRQAVRVSVDLSNTYLDWAHENLVLNGFGGPEHELQRADCLEWLESRARTGPCIRSDLPRSADLLELQAHAGRARRAARSRRA